MSLNLLKNIKFPDGLQMYCLPTSQSDARYIWWEIFEEQQYVQHGITIEDGDCIVNVGANIGMFDVFAARNWENLRILSFEPLPPVFEALEANVQRHLSEYSGEISLFPVGLSNEKGFYDIVFYPKAPGNSTMFPESKQREPEITAETISLSDLWKFNKIAVLGLLLIYPFRRNAIRAHIRNLYKNGRPYRCELTTLSEFIDDKILESINLLKIDVEGNEFNVLTGIREEHWHLIGQIVMEVSPSNLCQLEDFVKFLEERGFSNIHLQGMGIDTYDAESKSACVLYATR